MALRNWITRNFWWKKRPVTASVSENQPLVDLNNIIQSFSNETNSFREKLVETYKNIVNKTNRQLEEKQETISRLQKLIEKQQELIKELREQHVTYVPSKQQEETIEKLKIEVNRYEGIIKTYEVSANKLNAELEEIRLMYQKERTKYQEVANQLEKERDRASSLEMEIKEIRKGQEIPKELKEEIEHKTSLISEYEKSVKTLKNNLEEINDRYQVASEKYEKEKQGAIHLEMLILELDKELGLMDIIEKIETKQEETPRITVKNPR